MTDLVETLTTVVIGALISLAVGYVTARWYGPRWTLKESRKREHSVTLVTNTLAPWLHDPAKYCRLGVGFVGIGWGDFSPALNDGGGVLMRRGRGAAIRDPVDPALPYMNELLSHLNSAYPDVVPSWGSIKGGTISYNQDVFNLIQGFMSEIQSVLAPGVTVWQNENQPSSQSTDYLLLEDIAFLVWKELSDRVSGKPGQSPTLIEPDQEYGPSQCKVSWRTGHPTLVSAKEIKACRDIVSKIDHLTSSPVNQERVRQLQTSRRDELASKLKQFQDSLQEIKTQVDLGRNLKGKCSYCP